MKRRALFAFRAAVLFLLVSIVALVVFFQPEVTRGGRNDLADLGLQEFVQAEITYDGVMHELYWN